jgi:hypothetical protein
MKQTLQNNLIITVFIINNINIIYNIKVCGRSLAGIVGSNPAGGMDVCPF